MFSLKTITKFSRSKFQSQVHNKPIAVLNFVIHDAVNEFNHESGNCHLFPVKTGLKTTFVSRINFRTIQAKSVYFQNLMNWNEYLHLCYGYHSFKRSSDK